MSKDICPKFDASHAKFLSSFSPKEVFQVRQANSVRVVQGVEPKLTPLHSESEFTIQRRLVSRLHI